MLMAPETLASAAAEVTALRRDSLAALDARLHAPSAALV